MKIFCPICDMAIEVSKFLVGQKGRCPRCSSKFLIPESPDDEMEVLERGEIPADEPEPEPKQESLVPPKPKSKPAPVPRKETSRPNVAAKAPRVVPSTGAPASRPVRPMVVKQSSGLFGFLFALVLAGLVGVIVYVVMEKKMLSNRAAETPPENKLAAEVREPARPVPQPVEPVEIIEEEEEEILVYAKVLQPLLDEKCTGCHNPEKKKGRLAMDTYENLIAGGGNGPIVEPDADDATRIEMIFRAELPEDDDEHMPPQGKPQLTPDELAVLKWWVKEGAQEGIDSTEAPDEIKAKIKGLATL